MNSRIKKIKDQIFAALSHAEAEDGLYYNNLVVVHEDEERQIVEGDDDEVQVALEELLRDGIVVREESGDAPIFRLRAIM